MARNRSPCHYLFVIFPLGIMNNIRNYVSEILLLPKDIAKSLISSHIKCTYFYYFINYFNYKLTKALISYWVGNIIIKFLWFPAIVTWILPQITQTVAIQNEIHNCMFCPSSDSLMKTWICHHYAFFHVLSTTNYHSLFTVTHKYLVLCNDLFICFFIFLIQDIIIRATAFQVIYLHSDSYIIKSILHIAVWVDFLIYGFQFYCLTRYFIICLWKKYFNEWMNHWINE